MPEGWKTQETVSNRWGVARVRPRRKPLRKRPSDSSSGTCRQSGGGRSIIGRRQVWIPLLEFPLTRLTGNRSSKSRFHRGVWCVLKEPYVVSGSTVDWVARSAFSCLADIDVKKAPPQGIQGVLVAAAEVGREKASNPAVRTSHTQSR